MVPPSSPPPPPTPPRFGGTDQRKAPRYKYSAKAAITIIIPEDAGGLKSLEANTLDVSLGGLRVKVDVFPRDLHHKTMRGIREATLSVELPEDQKMVKLRGKVVWIEYHASREYDVGVCLLSVSFATLPDSQQADLKELVGRAEKLGVPAHQK